MPKRKEPKQEPYVSPFTQRKFVPMSLPEPAQTVYAIAEIEGDVITAYIPSKAEITALFKNTPSISKKTHEIVEKSND